MTAGRRVWRRLLGAAVARLILLGSLFPSILATPAGAALYRCEPGLLFKPFQGAVPGEILPGTAIYPTGFPALGTVVYTTMGIGLRQGAGDVDPVWLKIPQASDTLHAVSYIANPPYGPWPVLVLASNVTGFVGVYDPLFTYQDGGGNDAPGYPLVPPVDLARIYGLAPLPGGYGGYPKGLLVVDADLAPAVALGVGGIRFIAGDCVLNSATRPPGAFLSVTPGASPTTVDIGFTGGTVTEFFLGGVIPAPPLPRTILADFANDSFVDLTPIIGGPPVYLATPAYQDRRPPLEAAAPHRRPPLEAAANVAGVKICPGALGGLTVSANKNTLSWPSQAMGASYDLAHERFAGTLFDGDFTTFTNPAAEVGCPNGCAQEATSYNIGCTGSPGPGQLDMWIVRMRDSICKETWNEDGNQTADRDPQILTCP